MPLEGSSARAAVSAIGTAPFRGTVWRVHRREVGPTDWSLSLRSTGRYHRGLDRFPPDHTFAAL